MTEYDFFVKQFHKEFNKISTIDEDCFCLIKKELKLEEFKLLEYYSHVNEYPNKISFVCEGVLRIFHTDADGNDWNKHFLTENDFFAAGTNPEKPDSTAIQSLTPVKLLSVSLDAFLTLSAGHKQIDVFIQKLLSRAFEREKEKVMMHVSLDAPGRYEHFISKFPGLENRIQHYHIASYLGITPTQLSRIRSINKAHQQM
jgi:CRP-like cAMP-binding protein